MLTTYAEVLAESMATDKEKRIGKLSKAALGALLADHRQYSLEELCVLLYKKHRDWAFTAEQVGKCIEANFKHLLPPNPVPALRAAPPATYVPLSDFHIPPKGKGKRFRDVQTQEETYDSDSEIRSSTASTSAFTTPGAASTSLMGPSASAAPTNVPTQNAARLTEGIRQSLITLPTAPLSSPTHQLASEVTGSRISSEAPPKHGATRIIDLSKPLQSTGRCAPVRWAFSSKHFIICINNGDSFTARLRRSIDSPNRLSVVFVPEGDNCFPANCAKAAASQVLDLLNQKDEYRAEGLLRDDWIVCEIILPSKWNADMPPERSESGIQTLYVIDMSEEFVVPTPPVRVKPPVPTIYEY